MPEAVDAHTAAFAAANGSTVEHPFVDQPGFLDLEADVNLARAGRQSMGDGRRGPEHVDHHDRRAGQIDFIDQIGQEMNI